MKRKPTAAEITATAMALVCAEAGISPERAKRHWRDCSPAARKWYRKWARVAIAAYERAKETME